MHLSAGLFAAIVVVIMSVTGVLLTYELQLQQWERRGVVPIPASPENSRLPLEALIVAGASTRQKLPSTVTVSSDPGQVVTLSWGREATVMVNPYSGGIVPEGPTTVRDGLATIRTWHRWLGQEGESRPLGRSITGVCNMAFLFLVVSGLYLWFPRKWLWSNFKAILLFRGGLVSKARDFNWHNVIGVWSMIPLCFIVFSGAVISYPWVSDLVYNAFGEEAPVRRAPRSPGATSPRTGGLHGEPEALTPPAVGDFNLDAYIAMATEAEPGWRTLRINMPSSADEPVSLAIDKGSGRQPHLQSTIEVNRVTAEVLRRVTFSDQTPGSRARRLLRFAHTGEVAGVVGQTLAGLVSAGAVVLAYTGIALSWRRLRAWLARRANA